MIESINKILDKNILSNIYDTNLEYQQKLDLSQDRI